jgi:hypothetical protein
MSVTDASRLRGSRVMTVITAAGLWIAYSRPLVAQQPPPATPPTLQAYHPPAIALVEPLPDASVPQDRPIVVFRFAAGDSADPIDARSFVVTVDGKDRSALFEVVGDIASGPLAAPSDTEVAIAIGPHSLAARICSLRGTCGEVVAAVTIASSPAIAADQQVHTALIQTLVELLLALVKRLLTP